MITEWFNKELPLKKDVGRHYLSIIFEFNKIIIENSFVIISSLDKVFFKKIYNKSKQFI